MVCLTGIVVLFLKIFTAAHMNESSFQLCRSQVRQSSQPSSVNNEAQKEMTDLRVGQSTNRCPGALRAKPTGGNSFNISSARKRAFRRARQRAATYGQTVYRGRMHSAASLQALAQTTPADSSGSGGHTQRRRTAQPSVQRLQVRSWNMGGCTSDSYDVLCEWLDRQTDLDVLLVQETHWGLGRAESQWGNSRWTFFSSPDPARRYAGVAIIVSKRLASSEDCTFCEWVPGRLLQVRVECQKLNIDLVNVYQWVRDSEQGDKRLEQRSHVWHQLGRVVNSIPKRHLAVLGGDFNAGLRAHGNLIGKGLLQCSSDKVDEELQDLIIANHLCALNTWGSNRPAKCATFQNGQQRSQIDFIMVRRSAADQAARAACPTSVDLTPWRQGPKHRMIQCQLPKLAGWKLEQKGQARTAPILYSKEDLRWHQTHGTAQFQDFKAQVQWVTENIPFQMPIAELNRRLLVVCARCFPRQLTVRARPGDAPAVRSCISQMWLHHRTLRARRPGTSFLQIMAAWKRYTRFIRAWREVRRAGRAARRARIDCLVSRASEAATRHDMREVYRVVKQLAPKRKYESLRIRSPSGEVLTQKEQFQAIYQYYSAAFTRHDDFRHVTRHADVAFSAAEVEHAISTLKSHKAVPTGSPLAEVWKLSPGPLSRYLTKHIQHCRLQRQPLPSETTDCQLALLPKPGRPSRRPQDLRPLGLQDPSSKILACTLRDKIAQYAVPWLRDKPQFAYVPGRSIDEAILRVCTNCDRIKATLKASQPTVHTRRSGFISSGCSGGALLSLDLSRAFDALPRWALAASLRSAGTPVELCEMVMDLHEQCRYTICHHKHTGSFPMELGVRQGCSLSPLLFAIFTGYFYEELQARTDPSWAAKFVTLFADDTLLQWHIQSAADLRFLCKCVRVTFELFAELGMRVNASKSKLILSLRGGIAKRWLQRARQRTPQGYVIRLGTPAAPIDIPHVCSAVYLGIEISLDNYALRTCKHRMRLAAGIRQKLLKVLHTSGICLRTRAVLYAACVRSSMFYGQHAVGYTTGVLRLLDNKDARYLRALANSPSHITRESTADLRSRLRLKSPADVFQVLLAGRSRSCQSADSREGFENQRQKLIELQAQLLQPSAGGLLEVLDCEPVACNTCGVYFPDMRLLRSHQARKHGRTRAPKPTPREYVAQAVDGMPQCRYCRKKFTRVEGLQKHLRGSCRVKYQQSEPEAAEASVERGEVPSGHEELLGCSHRAPQAEVACTPLLDSPEFCTLIRTGWRSALRHKVFLRSLGLHCIICGQWASHAGGIKQHLRLAHPGAWQSKTEAVSKCSSLGLIADSPCRYCGLRTQEPRTHLSRCMAIFQASLASVLLLQDHGTGRSRDGGAGPARGGRGLWGDKPNSCGAEPARAGTGAGESRWSEAQMESPSLERTELRQGQLPWRRVARLQRSVELRAGSPRGARAGIPAQRGQDAHEARVGDATTSPRHDLDDVRGHSRAGSAVSHPGEGGEVAGALPGEEGHQQPPYGSSDWCLSGAGLTLASPATRSGTPHQDARGRLVGAGRAGLESQVDLPAVVTREAGCGDLAPGAHFSLPGARCDPGGDQQCGGRWGVATVPLDEAPYREDHERSAAVCPRVISARSAGDAGSSGNGHPRGECMPEGGGPPSSPRSGTAVGLGESPGGLVHGPIVCGLEASRSQLAAPAAQVAAGGSCPGEQRASLLRRIEPIRLRLSSCLCVPQGRLQNPSNLCYLNACAQVFAWTGQLADHAASCYGTAKAATKPVLVPGKPTLPQSLAWHVILGGWPDVNRQHDACQFMLHLLRRTKPAAYTGEWQARLTGPDAVVDAGDLAAPVLLDLAGETVPDLLISWHEQRTIHALSHHSGIVMLQLKRYKHEGSGPVKDQSIVRWQPGERVAVPAFRDSTGTEIRFEYFRIVWVLCHVGLQVETGHYQAVVCKPNADVGADALTSWQGWVLNDNCRPRLTTPRDTHTLERNCYLFGLVYDPGQP